MTTVICHIDTPGEREREKEKRRKKREERELGVLLRYTLSTLYIYFYTCMLFSSVYKVCSIFKGHIHTREALLLPMLKYATSAAIYAMGI